MRAVDRRVLEPLDPSRLVPVDGRPGTFEVPRDAIVPHVVAAAVPGGALRSVVFGDDPRRRVVLAVVRPSDGAEIIVKATRNPGEAERAAVESANLALLVSAGIDHVPTSLGHGEVDGIGWSAELRAKGVAMPRASGGWRRLHGRAVLGAVSRWLGDLGVKTVRPSSPSTAGEARAVVLAHGDLAGGENLLTHRRHFTVIDWETLDVDGPPLRDLLPTLTLGLAQVAGVRGPAQQCAHVVRMCSGAAPESAWLFDRVAEYCVRLGLRADEIGPLALEAWRHQGSLRQRHDDLVRIAGAEPVPWTSPAELVLDAWVHDAALADDWPAYRGHVRG